jgi:hypothetical protein
MRTIGAVLLVGSLASAAACGGSNGSAGAPDGDVDSPADGAATTDDGPSDGQDAQAEGSSDVPAEAAATPCPVKQPELGATCSGAIMCEYGAASCCGVPSSALTCKCQGGTFSCTQTVERNVVCGDF